MTDDARQYRADLLHGVLTLLSESEHFENLTDKHIEYAVTLTDCIIRKVDKWCDAVKPTVPAPPVVTTTFTPTRCQSGKDGDCVWVACPQLRDNEPRQTGRHCPLDDGEDGYE